MSDHEGNYELSRAVERAYDRMPQWRKDQFEAWVSEAVEVINRLADLMERWETGGIEAAEKFANGEKS